mgnify:FL=1
MTDLISQLFDIATNEEFSPEQRKELMGIALVAHKFGEARKSAPSSLNIDAALGRHLTKETLPNGGIRFGLASHLPTD